MKMDFLEQRTLAVIFDLDGTILDTESLCSNVARQVVAGHGMTLNQDVLKAASGKRPLEAWSDVVRLLDMKVSPQKLLEESEPLMAAQWADAGMLPGAMRILQHLHVHGIPFAVATSTPRATFNAKLSKKSELRDLLKIVVCGDEVENGKPHPDCFLKAAELLGVAASACVVIEDAVSGAESARRAGMRVVLVPSLSDRTGFPDPDPNCKEGVCQMLPSLMAFKPESLGLPPFDDQVHGVTPMDVPLRIKGKVVKGFGRGSKELGIPTANVDSDSLHTSLSEAVTGVYAGWVSIGASPDVYKTALSIGWNPHFGNTQKTCEPWILHNFDAPFYDQEIRLLICGYVRPEDKFTCLQALIDRILMDGEVSQKALDDPKLKHYVGDEFLKPAASE
ncbi:hypothetical protein CEUSTIGMA_g4251.t1 [Chlamydomonas eustigma]|uniref:riboflavin kinase n=1 Tax=Chlamydomonas eustigma TaxID=1157962 RepID=A0A250X174_9CHLO|nr:hypothetical protein CEUSTIGMA_g4251.t1 [Chlamydomonas eustigma]|eukprot:GAX76805.1 hypothetical protein CEUSTIGMA_g4251.t1 [Chlamydomonas eustigma]